METRTKHGLACVNKSKNLRTYVVRLSASTALCAGLAGCVSSDPGALGLAGQSTQQPVATPQLAVIAGDPSLSDSQQQSTDPDAAAILEQSQTIVQASNTPQLSPLKRQIEVNTVTSELAVANQTATIDPAVQQVENIADNSTSGSGTVSANIGLPTSESITTQQPAIVAAVQPVPQEVKKPSILERIFGRRLNAEPANTRPASQPVLATIQSSTQSVDVEQTASDTTAQETTSTNETGAEAENTSSELTQTQSDPITTLQGIETTQSEEVATTQQPSVVAALPANPPAEKPNLFARLFGNNKAETSSRPSNIDDRLASKPTSSRDEDDFGRNNLRNRFAGSKTRKTAKIRTVSRDANGNVLVQDNGSRSALPGVKSNNEIFGIEEAPQASESQTNTQLAALGNLGRLSPNGLRLQHEKVQVACLKPGVLQLLKIVERHYGKKPIVTSGYRSPKRNRRAGGARNSQHVFCKAVDIQVEGVSKWQLAKYLRSIPGRGGVGTYCRTKSVHVDIGKKRDWHHKCRRSAKRKRKNA